MSTEGRRTLRFESFDQVMPDVETLLAGHATVGAWSLGQILRHLATVSRRIVDLPATTPMDPSQWVSPAQKKQVFDSGVLPEGIPAPAEVVPMETLDPRDEAENLRQALAHYLASPGPVIAHRIFGPLAKEEWDRLALIHMAHHLSFAIPKTG